MMQLVRKDYILNRWVYYAPARAKRPHNYQKVSITDDYKCPFCPGNESLTPAEIGRIGDKEWIIRWFPNKFSVTTPKHKTITNKKFFSSELAHGYHEVIVETPEHKQLYELELSHLTSLLKVYALRIEELSKRDYIKYVVVFKNKGVEAGTSILHPHSQVIALTHIPDLIKQESVNKVCVYCKIIKIESESQRNVFENKNFISFCPYASRFPYEIWIFPKRHITNITQFDAQEYKDLAKMLRLILKKLKDKPYNFYLHYSPKGKNLHFHIEILPRLAILGGFELSSNFFINPVLPEEAARFYKNEKNNLS